MFSITIFQTNNIKNFILPIVDVTFQNNIISKTC